MDQAKLDALVAQYLHDRGYTDVADALKAKVETGGGEVVAGAGGGGKAAGGAAAATLVQPPPSLQSYARRLGLDASECSSNQFLFWGVENGDPEAYASGYRQLHDWIVGSLECYKHELHRVAFPLFVHCYLELVARGLAPQAAAFFDEHSPPHATLHAQALQQLTLVRSGEHLTANEYARRALACKFEVEMSAVTATPVLTEDGMVWPGRRARGRPVTEQNPTMTGEPTMVTKNTEEFARYCSFWTDPDVSSALWDDTR